MIYVIDDDEIMAGCIERACGELREVKIFTNGIEAAQALDQTGVPDLIFLDILLDGPDGFTFLNELASYADTAVVPVVVVSSLDLAGRDLSVYNVVGVLDKNTMLPEEIKNYVVQYDENKNDA
ncbi:response regulator [Candidatus Saccharibacteria bacterium]|nr:response regulator [Candidatus Saccharibacteria bacterium]